MLIFVNYIGVKLLMPGNNEFVQITKDLIFKFLCHRTGF